MPRVDTDERRLARYRPGYRRAGPGPGVLAALDRALVALLVVRDARHEDVWVSTVGFLLVALAGRSWWTGAPRRQLYREHLAPPNSRAGIPPWGVCGAHCEMQRF